MSHLNPQRVGNNIIGTRYIFTIPLKNGNAEKVTLQPLGRATRYFKKMFFGGLHDCGSEGCYSIEDSKPDLLIKKINDGGVVVCDSGRCIVGTQVVKESISCVCETCTTPMEITTSGLE